MVVFGRGVPLCPETLLSRELMPGRGVCPTVTVCVPGRADDLPGETSDAGLTEHHETAKTPRAKRRKDKRGVRTPALGCRNTMCFGVRGRSPMKTGPALRCACSGSVHLAERCTFLACSCARTRVRVRQPPDPIQNLTRAVCRPPLLFRPDHKKDASRETRGATLDEMAELSPVKGRAPPVHWRRDYCSCRQRLAIPRTA